MQRAFPDPFLLPGVSERMSAVDERVTLTMDRSLLRRHGRLAPASVLLALAVSSSLPVAATAPAQVPRAAAPLSIDHQAPRCVLAGMYPRLGACFQPPAALARARVYFRAGGTLDWFYVEMAGPPPCLEGTLPRPKKGLRDIEYYVAATDRSFGESRTPERVLLVSSDGRCSAGPMAPFAEASNVVIGSVSGAAPAGFLTGGGLSPLLIAGGVAVVGGGTAAIVKGTGGGESPPTTTTLLSGSTTTTTAPSTSTTTTTTTTTTRPPRPPTTTTTTLPPPTTTTTTTTTLPPCETVPPAVTITYPPTGTVGGLSATLTADASDPSPSSGLKEVRFYYQYCPGTPPACGPFNLIGADTTAPYSVDWLFPGCSADPENRFRIVARAEDNCGNVSPDAGVDVRLEGRGCFRADAARSAASTAAWTSALSVPGGRGQVVVDGTQAVFPAGGTETFAAPTGPGTHRLEAVLVDGAGRVGTWRFDLSALGVAPGSLRTVAGEAALTGAAEVVFRLRGKPGERVVFTFQVGSGQ